MNRILAEQHLQDTLLVLRTRAGSDAQTALALQEILRLNFKQAMQVASLDFTNILTKKLAAWDKQLKHVLEIN